MADATNPFQWTYAGAYGEIDTERDIERTTRVFVRVSGNTTLRGAFRIEVFNYNGEVSDLISVSPGDFSEGNFSVAKPGSIPASGSVSSRSVSGTRTWSPTHIEVCANRGDFMATDQTQIEHR